MTLAEAPPGTRGHLVCAAASLAFLRPRFARCAAGSGGAQPDAGSASLDSARWRGGSEAGSSRGCLWDPPPSAPSQWRVQLIGGSRF